MRDHHRALIYTMLLVSGAARQIAEAELRIIGDIVGHLPVFQDFERDQLPSLLNDCAELLNKKDGVQETLNAIRTLLPSKLRETAYVIACDLVAADATTTREELQVLDLLRRRLGLDRLVAAAIERGAHARFQTV